MATKTIWAVARIEFEMEVNEDSSDDEILAYFHRKLYCDGDTTILSRIQKYHEKRKAEGKCICDVMDVELLPREEDMEPLPADFAEESAPF